MMDVRIKVPKVFHPLFSNNKRYAVLYGGRGSGKSHTAALYFLQKSAREKRRVLCVREVQNSIRDSVHRLLSDKIEQLALDRFFEIKNDSIIARNGSEYIFKGLLRNVHDIKSMEGITDVWVEEAQSVSRRSLELLIPTIRAEGSQIVFTYNPTNEDDPVHQDFTLSDRDDVLRIRANWNDNPAFPEVLRHEMEHDRRIDLDKYYHIWEGQCVKHSEAQVFFRKWHIEDFETPADVVKYYGADWGFAKDPTALVRCFIKDNKLYIDYEAYGVGVDIDKTPDLFRTVPEVQGAVITADSARPETISYLRQHGFPRIKGAIKGAGSVEEGVAFLRSFEKIIIHPRCKHTADEFRLYSYKVDKHTGQIQSKLEDTSNHCVDALRYALEDMMKNRRGTTNIIQGW